MTVCHSGRRHQPFSTLRSSPVTLHLLGIFTLVIKKKKKVSLVPLSKTAVQLIFIKRQQVNIENYEEGKDSCPFDVCVALATSLNSVLVGLCSQE